MRTSLCRILLPNSFSFYCRTSQRFFAGPADASVAIGEYNDLDLDHKAITAKVQNLGNSVATPAWIKKELNGVADDLVSHGVAETSREETVASLLSDLRYHLGRLEVSNASLRDKFALIDAGNVANAALAKLKPQGYIMKQGKDSVRLNSEALGISEYAYGYLKSLAGNRNSLAHASITSIAELHPALEAVVPDEALIKEIELLFMKIFNVKSDSQKIIVGKSNFKDIRSRLEAGIDE